MKYLCLIYDDEKQWDSMPQAEVEKVYGEYWAFGDSVKASGHYLGANALQPTQTATTVRVRNGKGGVARRIRGPARALAGGGPARQSPRLARLGGAVSRE